MRERRSARGGYKWWALPCTSVAMLLADMSRRKRACALGFTLFTLASLGAGLHHAVWLLAGCSLLGAVVSPVRPRDGGLLEQRESAERAA